MNISKPHRRSIKAKNYTPDQFVGVVFGRLTVLSVLPAQHKTGWRKYTSRVLCKCSCGKTVERSLRSLIRGKNTTLAISSCGCRMSEKRKRGRTIMHGFTKKGSEWNKEYLCWQMMMYSCRKFKNRNHPSDARKRVKVCRRWKDVRNFIADMGHVPHGHAIIRKDRNGDFEPENCEWVPFSKHLEKHRVVD